LYLCGENHETIVSGVVAAGLTVPALADPPNSPTGVIETTSGPIRGVSNGVVNKFQGIRYANSPAGTNRWTPPAAPVRSHTVFDANHAG
jgi:Carboxylesterase family